MPLTRHVCVAALLAAGLTLVLRAQTPPVRLYLEALDANGPGLGLTADAVEVFEGGVTTACWPSTCWSTQARQRRRALI